MSRVFTKSNRITGMLNSQGRREHRFYTILTILLFILGAFSFWEFIYELCNMIGSISCGDPGRALAELFRMLPLILTSFVYVYLQVYCLHAFRASSVKKRARIWAAGGVATMILGLGIAGYTVFGVITGTYAGIVEGYISPLFPLDIAIGGILFMVYGFFAVKYSRRIRKDGSNLPCPEKKRFAIFRFLGRIFCLLSYLVALCGFAACFYGTYVLDWTHGRLFFNIMLWLNYFIAFVMAVFFRFVYCELKSEYRRPAMKRAGLVFLIINIILFVVYLGAVQIQNEAPNLNAFGILPIEFTASFNAFLPIYGLNNLLGPLTAFIRGLIRNRARSTNSISS